MALRSRLTQLFSALIGIVLFGISIWVIAQELKEHSVQKILDSLAAIPLLYVGLAIGLTVLNYIALTGYDALAIRYIHRSVPYRRIALVAVISCAISNSIGFALLSGSAIRYWFYSRWGLSVIEIAQVITFTHLSFFLGLFAVGGVMFALEPITVPSLLQLPFKSVHPIGLLFLSIIVLYLFWSWLSRQSLRVGRWTIPHLPL
jgi:glycosyltransferase 2 family protein